MDHINAYRRLRLDLRWSQTEMAEAITEEAPQATVDQKRVSEYERGMEPPVEVKDAYNAISTANRKGRLTKGPVIRPRPSRRRRADEAQA